MTLYFVSARTPAGHTVWAGHLYAPTPTKARELAHDIRRKDHEAMPPALRYANDMFVTWHARRSSAHHNAINTEG